MIVGLGIDVVEICRVEQSLKRFAHRFLHRLLTAEELAQLPPANQTIFVAGRFAAKEAAVKALGTGFRDGVTFRNVQILNNDMGKPTLHFFGPALERFRMLGADNLHISLTHSRQTAAAVVVLESSISS